MLPFHSLLCSTTISLSIQVLYRSPQLSGTTIALKVGNRRKRSRNFCSVFCLCSLISLSSIYVFKDDLSENTLAIFVYRIDIGAMGAIHDGTLHFFGVSKVVQC